MNRRQFVAAGAQLLYFRRETLNLKSSKPVSGQPGKQ
jgi:hypothetical protein